MESTYSTPYLDFYRENNVIPVNQNLDDLSAHFERRDSLFRHCNIYPFLIKDKDVLEFGPGTGHNSIHIKANGPAFYQMVDGFEVSIQKTRENIEKYHPENDNCEFTHSTINGFQTERSFDFVLCEGLLGTQLDPESLVKKISSFVGPSGVMLISVNDDVSVLSESLRRILAILLSSGKKLDFQQKVTLFSSYFANDIASLRGMTRSIEDWVIDNIIQPNLGKMLSIEDAILTVQDSFIPMGVSPRFWVDWRWYKQIHGEANQPQKELIQCYHLNLHNLLDYRISEPAMNEDSTGKILAENSSNIMQVAKQMPEELTKSELSEILSCLDNIKNALPPQSSEVTIKSIQAVQKRIDEFNNKSFDVTESPTDDFTSWFGRGQQYISFYRNH
jgi:SAM-dependent methyltransferase